MRATTTSSESSRIATQTNPLNGAVLSPRPRDYRRRSTKSKTCPSVRDGRNVGLTNASITGRGHCKCIRYRKKQRYHKVQDVLPGIQDQTS